MNNHFCEVAPNLSEIKEMAMSGNSSASELLSITYALGKGVTGIRANYLKALDYSLLGDLQNKERNKSLKYNLPPKETDLRVEWILNGSLKVDGYSLLKMFDKE